MGLNTLFSKRQRKENCKISLIIINTAKKILIDLIPTHLNSKYRMIKLNTMLTGRKKRRDL